MTLASTTHEMISPDELQDMIDAIPKQKNNKRLMRDFPHQLIIYVLEHNDGKVRQSVEHMEVKYADFHMHLEQSINLQTVVARYRAEMIDLAEEKLRDKLNNGEMRAIEFTLDRLGKTRGYSKELTVLSPDQAADPRDAIDLSKLSTEELNQYRQLALKASPDAGS